MRVLVLSALFACAAAAPSFIAPVPLIVPGLLPTVYAVAPTVAPGDIQAAAIDAQVEIENQSRAIADKSRELAELADDNRNEGVIEANDLAKERSEEAFWSAEELKNQALDRARSAEAAADGALAGSADTIAKSSLDDVAGVVPEVTPVAATEVQEPQAEEVKPEAKAAEPEQPEKLEEKKEEDNATENKAETKSAEPTKAENADATVLKSVIHPVPLGLAPYSYQAIVPPVAYAHVGLRAYPAIPSFQHIQAPFYTPTIFKTVY